MQTAISWGNYVIGVLIISAGYYLFIGYRFYRQDIKAFFTGKWRSERPMLAQQYEAQASGQEISYEKEIPMEGSFDELEELVYEIKTAILEEAGDQADKAKLTLMLMKRLSNYTGLRKPAIRVAVNHFIIRQAQETCNVDYTEDELNGHWKSLGF